ncbi:MAG: hypothetical protein N2321_10350 [Melioribacteraceae bacterium]|nr:hypothetical protein [Melioribacteraceae bacterium]
MNFKILLLLFSFIYINLFAQIDTLKSPMMKVILKDSSVYYGRIISSEYGKLNFIDKNGIEFIIPKESILEIYRMQDLPKESPKKEIVKDSAKVEEKKYIDKSLHRMFFFPTANAIPHGEGFISSNMIFFPFAAIGLANIFTVGGGISILPGATNQIYYLAPKITFLSYKNFTFATGGFVTNSTDFSKTNNKFGMLYLIGTYNKGNNNFTAGLAYGYSDSEFDDSPMIFLGLQSEIKNGSKFLSEIWIPSSKTSFPEIAIIFFGFRFYNENFSGDIGLVRPTNFSNNGFPFIPWINLTYNFTFIKNAK